MTAFNAPALNAPAGASLIRQRWHIRQMVDSIKELIRQRRHEFASAGALGNSQQNQVVRESASRQRPLYIDKGLANYHIRLPFSYIYILRPAGELNCGGCAWT